MGEVMEANGIPVLRNQSHPIERSGARLHLVGVDNVTAGHARPEKAFRGVPQNECAIAAVHEPDIADELRKFSADFQMSGHSHGGQIRLPAVGAVVLPPGARKYPRGAYRVGQLQLYTNSGIGVIGLPMRFMCPPEVSIFELRTPGAKA
jgi:predicted MPP superfamily phosphohydrolase